MSVNKYDSSTGTLTTLANGTRIWLGTQTAHDAEETAGTLPTNCLIAITDDGAFDVVDAIEDGNTSAVTSNAVYDALGGTDISSIGDGTVTGAIDSLNTDLSNIETLTVSISSTYSNTTTITLYKRNGVVSASLPSLRGDIAIGDFYTLGTISDTSFAPVCDYEVNTYEPNGSDTRIRWYFYTDGSIQIYRYSGTVASTSDSINTISSVTYVCQG